MLALTTGGIEPPAARRPQAHLACSSHTITSRSTHLLRMWRLLFFICILQKRDPLIVSVWHPYLRWSLVLERYLLVHLRPPYRADHEGNPPSACTSKPTRSRGRIHARPLLCLVKIKPRTSCASPTNDTSAERSLYLEQPPTEKIFR